ncbi:MAG: hypothetical protein ACFCVK_21485, partial [Acidimicrobiales bacterium]
GGVAERRRVAAAGGAVSVVAGVAASVAAVADTPSAGGAAPGAGERRRGSRAPGEVIPPDAQRPVGLEASACVRAVTAGRRGAGTAVLVKGSRVAGLEVLARALLTAE